MFTPSERFQRGKEEAAKMPRKEINAAYAHMYCDQYTYAVRIQELEKKLKKAKEQMEIAMLDSSVRPENRADAEILRRGVRDRLKACLSHLESDA